MISFIIPAYNSEKTIKRCIDSILDQTSDIEYEIIVVDDGSTDNTEELVRSYINDKIKFYQKQNGGVASARNFGVDNSSGEYIIFVDSDDYINKNLLRDITPYINKKLDLIKWNPAIVNEKQDGSIEVDDKNKKITAFRTTSGENGFNKLFGMDPLLDCLWEYAIKRDIMLKFPEGMYHEDFAIMPLIILNAKDMIAIPKIEYFYVQTDTSIMRGNDEAKELKKLQDILSNYDSLMKRSSELNLKKTTKENVGIFCTNSLIVIVPNLKGKNRKYFIKELKKRKVSKNIKVRNFKQLIKRVLLTVLY